MRAVRSAASIPKYTTATRSPTASATAPLAALSVVALLLAYDGAASTLLRAVMVPVGVVAVLVAALRRAVASTLRGLLR